MWIMTTVGFFSIVQKPNDNAGTLTIRSRVRDDLEQLRKTYLPSLSPIAENSGSDYPYRAQVKRSELANALGRMILDLNYSNFKNEIYRQQGPKRAKAYGLVWEVLYDLESHSL